MKIQDQTQSEFDVDKIDVLSSEPRRPVETSFGTCATDLRAYECATEMVQRAGKFGNFLRWWVPNIGDEGHLSSTHCALLYRHEPDWLFAVLPPNR
jgi:hypothetical protein